ncbi:hypothetical protein ENSA5_60850 [Enhygromyxa salina]|uniref:Uncharacterized protein n=1 Tax=Enhygromyxa salina TaxID=215803 RepID=A0A2S9XDA4_9BACT|nr:Ig-like domain-containing protein [Enhygromyxa salina]PRP90835.1 hypothetical protein ENSA5_60850 [Enhygromyxa salina]
MATSIRINVGLQEFQFERGSAIHLGAGELLRPRDAIALIRGLRGARELDTLRALAVDAVRRSFEWDEELHDVLAGLIACGRLRVRKIDAQIYRTLGATTELPELPPSEPVDNEIVETHSVMIELIDAEGNPVPGEPFRIKLPDGVVKQSTLDAEGKAHITGIVQPGTCEVCFYERDAEIWAPA